MGILSFLRRNRELERKFKANLEGNIERLKEIYVPLKTPEEVDQFNSFIGAYITSNGLNTPYIEAVRAYREARKNNAINSFLEAVYSH